MFTDNMQKTMNQQINAEYYSSYLYLSMEAYFESLNLPGFAHWMHIQALEENIHALKFFNFIHERGGRVALTSIQAPPTEWKSPQEVFEASLKHEQHVTSLINNLVNVAIAEKDHASNAFLQWFVNEQVEEESSADKILRQLRMIEGRPEGLLLLDRELAARQPPAEAAVTPPTMP